MLTLRGNHSGRDLKTSLHLSESYSGVTSWYSFTVPSLSCSFFASLKASFIFAQSFPELSLSDLLPKVPQNLVCSSPFKKHTFLPDVVPCFFPHTHKKIMFRKEKKREHRNDIRIYLLMSRAAAEWGATGLLEMIWMSAYGGISVFFFCCHIELMWM